MDVLVLGGTRLIGPALVPRLLAAGHHVTVASRGNARPAYLSQVEHVPLDRFAEGLGKLSGRAFDAVIDNIAYEPSHVTQVSDALGARAGHYFFTSTALVADPRPGAALTEDDTDLDGVPAGYPDDRHARYVHDKRRCERLLRAGGFPAPWTILRPVNVYGPGDPQGRLSWWVARVLDGGPVLLPDDFPAEHLAGHNVMVYAGDVARAQELCLSNPAARGDTFHLAMDEAPSAAAFVGLLAEVLGRSPPTVARVPREVLDRTPLADNPAGTYRVPGLFGGCRYDACRARQLLGWRPTPLRDWLAAVAPEVAAGPAARPPEAERRLEVEIAARWVALVRESGERVAAEFPAQGERGAASG